MILSFRLKNANDLKLIWCHPKEGWKSLQSDAFSQYIGHLCSPAKFSLHDVVPESGSKNRPKEFDQFSVLLLSIILNIKIKSKNNFHTPVYSRLCLSWHTNICTVFEASLSSVAHFAVI